MEYHLCNIPAKDAQSESKHKDILDKYKWKDILKSHWPIIFESVRISSQGKSEEPSQIEGDERDKTTAEIILNCAQLWRALLKCGLKMCLLKSPELSLNGNVIQVDLHPSSPWQQAASLSNLLKIIVILSKQFLTN